MDHEADFHVRFSGDSLAHLRAAFLTIDDAPPATERLFEIGYSAALHGSDALLEAHVPTPQRITGGGSLWLTVEDWQG